MSDIWTRLKEQNPIEEVITEWGAFAPLRGRGRTLKSDVHSSFVVDVGKGYYFWNAQGRGGSVVDYLVNEHQMTLEEAGEWLARRAGIEFHESEHDRQKAVVRRVQREALGVVHEYLRLSLLGRGFGEGLDMADLIAQQEGRGMTASVAALRYAQRRGFTAETLRESGAGFWDGDQQKLADFLRLHGVDTDHPAAVAVYGWAGDVPAWGRKYGLDLSGRPNWVEARKIYGMKGGMFVYAHMERGQMCYLAARAIDPSTEKRFAHYNPVVELMGERRAYWNHAVGREDEWVVVVEGQADALTLAQWGVPALALAGLSLDERAMAKLAGYGAVVVALDGDAAGQDGNTAEKLLAYLSPAQMRMATWPEGVKDANDWLQQGGTAAQAMGLLGNGEIYPVWLAKRAMAAPAVARDGAVRDVLEKVAALGAYDVAAHGRAVATALGVNVTQFQRMVREVQRELAAVAAVGEQGSRGAGEQGGKGAGEQGERVGMKRLSESLAKEVFDELKRQPCDHEGHAQCVLALYGQRMAYVPEWGWMVWNGTHYDREGGEQSVERIVTETLIARGHVAVEIGQMDMLKGVGRSRRNVTGTRDQLATLCVAKPSDFDTQPDYLNCANGVVDLRTGELAAHDAAVHRFTYCIPTAYVPTANYDHWLDFMEEVVDRGTSTDAYEQMRVLSEMIIYLQMAAGYSLTGRTRENCLFYIYGPTRSGKGTFIQTLMEIMGKPLASAIDFQTLIADRNGDTQGFDLAGLVACRLVSASESGKYERLNAEKIKQVTGQDAIRCSFKRKDHFTYTPQFKIWLQSNHPINIDVYDDAVWGRLHVVEFPNSYLGREDLLLKERLHSKESLEGVLAWAVDGAMMWYSASAEGVPAVDGRKYYGLPLPTAVRDATSRQRNAQDFLQMFLDECAEVADPSDQQVYSPFAKVYSAYKTWCSDLGITEMKQRAFSLAMLNGKRYKSAKQWVDGKTKQCYLGIRLAPPSQKGQLALLNGHQGGEKEA